MRYHYHIPFTGEETEAETETDPSSRSQHDLNLVLSDSKTRNPACWFGLGGGQWMKGWGGLGWGSKRFVTESRSTQIFLFLFHLLAELPPYLSLSLFLIHSPSVSGLWLLGM